MTKLRYILPHGPHKPGDVQLTESPTTVHWLVDVYRVAIIEPENPVATADPDEPVTDTTAQKFLRVAPQDKMVRTSRNKRSRY